jgi:hypothetical protein
VFPKGLPHILAGFPADLQFLTNEFGICYRNNAPILRQESRKRPDFRSSRFFDSPTISEHPESVTFVEREA